MRWIAGARHEAATATVSRDGQECSSPTSPCAGRALRLRPCSRGWGKRYGDPLLDALRELIRYAYPRPSGGGRVGSTIRDEVRGNLLRAVFGEEQNL
jgi:hypothetical protein